VTAARTVDWEHHLDVIDMIAELVDRHQHREHYTLDESVLGYQLGRDHVVRAPSLLAQLEHANPSGEGEERSGGGYESRPPARIEALDTFMLIDQEASRWVRDWKIDDAGLSTIECVRKVGALLPQMDRCHRHKPLRKAGAVTCCEWHSAEHDVRRWWAQARIVAGWDVPAWRPDATCPLCEERGTLRVRFLSKVAVCTSCREIWDPSTISLLADHIREQTFTVRELARTPECGRMVDWEPERLTVLCPRCGSSRCRRALAIWLSCSRGEHLAGPAQLDGARFCRHCGTRAAGTTTRSAS
jgi:5-methylcytosine-specific restriction endonuclease McrA